MILGSPLLGSLERRRSSGAEQLSCKQQVVGSNPTAGSLETRGSRPCSDPFGLRGEALQGASSVASLAQPRLSRSR